MSGGRIAALIVGVVLALAGLAAALAGVGMLVGYAAQRDGGGYVTSPEFSLRAPDHAVVSEEIDLGVVPDPAGVGGRVAGPDVRLTVSAADGGQAVFVGIGPSEEVEAYLAGVAHQRVVRLAPGDVRYRDVPGQGEPAVPGEQAFWVASEQGAGVQQLDWTPQAGEWTVVVMNADASAPVAVTATAGARADALLPIGLAAVAVGVLLLIAGAVLVVVATSVGRGAVTPVAGVASSGGAGDAPASTRYPLRVAARLDAPGRWLWLVKWLLAIPHYVVLVVLWVVLVVLTVAAGVAILATGRYPRGIFAFNVGVLRWTWRVGFYAYSALGTDRYPPFTLAARPDYPADLDVVYPERLSRGLVLVKWWLLALPHYLIVAVLTGGVLSWTYEVAPDRSWQIALGGGLIGLLVLIAAVALLFTARYPAGLFDLVVGLNRWVYRVVVYAALMTDRYPPFRLDLGGADPAIPPPPPPAPRPGTDTSPPQPVGT